MANVIAMSTKGSPYLYNIGDQPIITRLSSPEASLPISLFWPSALRAWNSLESFVSSLIQMSAD